jgi:hypothetical protein
MSERFHVRPVRSDDNPQWRPLWDGYNDFYQRRGPTAVPEAVTQATWERFFDPVEPMWARSSPRTVRTAASPG